MHSSSSSQPPELCNSLETKSSFTRITMDARKDKLISETPDERLATIPAERLEGRE